MMKEIERMDRRWPLFSIHVDMDDNFDRVATVEGYPSVIERSNSYKEAYSMAFMAALKERGRLAAIHLKENALIQYSRLMKKTEPLDSYEAAQVASYLQQMNMKTESDDYEFRPWSHYERVYHV